MSCDNPDFLNEDFYHEDFNVNKFRNRFKKWFRDIIPLHIKILDSYKNAEDEGLYERYMSLFGDNIDSDIMPEINCYLNIIDASITDEKYLNHISDVLGNPPDVFKNINQYRNLLSYIVSVYKIKGTKDAYSLFFGILGFNVQLIEIPILNEESLYDQEGIYDRNNIDSVYDQDICQSCSDYDIIFSYSDTGNIVLDSNIVNLLRAAISFNEPINARLRSLTMVLPISDNLSIIMDDNVDTFSERIPNYDSGNLHDDTLLYDTESIIPGSNIQGNIRWSSNLNDEQLILSGDLLILSGHNYNINTSYIVVSVDDGVSEYTLGLGQFIQGNISGGYLENHLLAHTIPITGNIYNVNFQGRLYLDSGEYYNFNHTQIIGTTTYSDTYFNNY